MNEYYSSADKYKDKNYDYFNTNVRRCYINLPDNANSNEIGEDRISKEDEGRDTYTRFCGSLLFPKKQTKGYAKKNAIKMNILTQVNQMNVYLIEILIVRTQQIILLDIIMNVWLVVHFII